MYVTALSINHRKTSSRSSTTANGKGPRNSTPCILCSILFALYSPLLALSSPPVAADELPVRPLFVIDGFSKGQKFAAPLGVFYDKRHHEIYVADTGNDQVDVFDADGQPRFQIRSTHGLKTPIDVVVDPYDQVYISQMEKSCLQILDFRGRHLADLHAPDATPFKPGRMCFDAEGNLYVVDREKARILVYDPEGNLQSQFGSKGKEEGQFLMISGIATDSAGQIYVADSKQRPIQVFDRNGKFLRSFGKHGPRQEEFSFPGSISIDEKGRIWIVDTFRHHVKVFKTDGSFQSQFGAFGTEVGQLFFPIDIALGEYGRIYILEKGANRLQVFEIKE